MAHLELNLLVQFRLEFLEGGLNLLFAPALLINFQDATFKVHTGFNGAKDLVAGAEDPSEQIKLLFQQRVNPLVGFITLVEEVDHDDVVLLAITVASADSLFNALGVPG